MLSNQILNKYPKFTDFQCKAFTNLYIFYLIKRGTHRRNGLKFHMFMYDKILVTVCWFYLFWWHFDLVKQVKIVVSNHVLENTWEEWPEIWHDDVSWTDVSSTNQNNTLLGICECNAVLLRVQKLDTKTLWHHVMYKLAVSSGTFSWHFDGLLQDCSISSTVGNKSWFVVIDNWIV